MAEFLSDEWFDALRAAAEAAPWPAEPLRLGVRITGPNLEYTVVVGNEPDVIVGSADSAEVVLVGSFEATRDLAEGRRSVGELLEEGAIRVVGNLRKLAGAGDLLGALAPDQRDRAR